MGGCSTSDSFTLLFLHEISPTPAADAPRRIRGLHSSMDECATSVSYSLLFLNGVFANPHSFLAERPTDASLKYCIGLGCPAPFFKGGWRGHRGRAPSLKSLKKSLVKRVLGSKVKPWPGLARRGQRGLGQSPISRRQQV